MYTVLIIIVLVICLSSSKFIQLVLIDLHGFENQIIN